MRRHCRQSVTTTEGHRITRGSADRYRVSSWWGVIAVVFVATAVLTGCGNAHHASKPTAAPTAAPFDTEMDTEMNVVDWCVYDKKTHQSYHVRMTSTGHRTYTKPGKCSSLG